MRTYRAIDIARWFIAWADNIDAEVSNLKLQKLLYYAQGHRLGSVGEPLFGDELEAWAHGPVVRSVYHAFKDYGKSPIDPDPALEDFDWDDFKEIEDFLIDVWDRYGSLAAWALRERTHREPPWRDAFEAEARGRVIPRESIASFFASIPLSTDG
ncbi:MULTISPECIES: Panacea domain-containing protein [Rhodococcus]|uniref:Panacea domain-containing protein n=1 Tax=Rhodococcus TaxID=1827 RepID=UPI000C9B3295|nr:MULTISPECIES: type II toxin-antitoxin system antitoxin SocA domain-containing protein [Rhodococcus]PND52553.1 hypothetical protein CQZ88_08105 [Rhodococcus sp. ENV425]WKX01433.1 DUF4065 domain-containing protein [Rhodococcus aetherivorans]